MSINGKKLAYIHFDSAIAAADQRRLDETGAAFVAVPGVLSGLRGLADAGYQLVVAANLGRGGEAASSAERQRFAAGLDLLRSQGVVIDEVVACPHAVSAACLCRLPHLGLMRHLLPGMDAERSVVIGGGGEAEALACNLGLPLATVDTAHPWAEVAPSLTSKPRRAEVKRRTRETDITIRVDLDAPPTGQDSIKTGIGFFDHMLDQLGRHGGFALSVQVVGDLEVDEHHTVEDTGLALGEALSRALGDRRGIERFGFVLPMDEARATVAMDLSGRPWLEFRGAFGREVVGGLPTELVAHFFGSLAQALGATLHIEVQGANAHHMIEAVFKGVARSLRQAIRASGDRAVPSTKGVL